MVGSMVRAPSPNRVLRPGPVEPSSHLYRPDGTCRRRRAKAPSRVMGGPLDALVEDVVSEHGDGGVDEP
jgi:hypothetical protein